MGDRINLPTRSERNSDVGHVWVERLTNAMGTIEVPKYASIRVRATGATTVTVDGTLAVTMTNNEIIIVNAGRGAADDNKDTVTVVIGGAAAFVQVSRTTEVYDKLY